MANNPTVPTQLSRRDLLRISTVGGSALGVHLFMPGFSPALAKPLAGQLPTDLYTTTLHSCATDSCRINSQP
jgi:TctA family transporter